MSGLRDERRAAAREGLLAAAHRIVAEGGCAAASVARVAERAGVANGSLYRHFATRDELLVAVLANVAASELALLRAAAVEVGEEADGPQRVAALARAFAQRARTARQLLRALWVEPLPAAVAPVRVAARGDLRDLLEGLLPPGPAATVAAAAIAGALVAATLADPRPAVEADELEVLLGGLAARLAAGLR